MHGGVVRLSYIREYIDQNRIYVGSTLSYVGAIRHEHDEVRTINERETIRLSAGISERASLAVEVPFVRRQHTHIHHEDVFDAWESWDFSGLGDLRLTGEFVLTDPAEPDAPVVSFVAGVKFATGATDIANAEGKTAEASLQPGTGSTDGILGVRYRQNVAAVRSIVGGQYAALPLMAGVDYQMNGRGTGDWMFGAVCTAHAGTAYAWSPASRLLLQADARIQDFAGVGMTGEPRENTGGTWIFISPGLEIDLLPSVTAYGYIQLPLYQNVHGIQQTAPYNLQFGISADVEAGGD
jgi:hypothetical protein